MSFLRPLLPTLRLTPIPTRGLVLPIAGLHTTPLRSASVPAPDLTSLRRGPAPTPTSSSSASASPSASPHSLGSSTRLDAWSPPTPPSARSSYPNRSSSGTGTGTTTTTSGPSASDDTWWESDLVLNSPARRARMGETSAQPGNQYAGRTVETRNGDVGGAMRSLAIKVGRSGVRQDVRRGEYYERPSEKRRRLSSERHRTRFQEMIREKVQMVQLIRNRSAH